MILNIYNVMERIKADEQTFFRMAHVWSFGTDPDVSSDVAQFILHGIVPKYVEKYAAHCREQFS